MNDTVLTQRREGLFTEGRWRKQSTAGILADMSVKGEDPSV